MKAAPVCPTCKAVSKPHPENQAFPFCSARCKLAELGNWLDGRYRVAAEPASRDDDVDDAN